MGRSLGWPKATSFLGGSAGSFFLGKSPVDEAVQGYVPRNFFEMNICWNAVWCILRHNFEKC